jgi:5'(3')-deoxyribonucleotidase
MNKFKYIYLDMDGVLVNFAEGVANILGDPPNKITSWNVCEWYGITGNTLWRVLEPINNSQAQEDFWTMLRPYGWCDQLIRELETYDLDIILTTTPTTSSRSLSGKASWINSYLPRFNRSFIMTPRKELLSKEGILIDDSNYNVEEFERRGGKAILFPQPWNSNRHVDGRKAAMEYINICMRDILNIKT